MVSEMRDIWAKDNAGIMAYLKAAEWGGGGQGGQ